MQILHISADFPDPLVPGKTRAVQNLLTLVPQHEHRIFSLNRVDFRHGVRALDFGPGHKAVAYGAPPKGIALATRLDRVAEFILDEVTRAGLSPDVVHAHKLSVEGLVGVKVAERLARPLIVSSQGDSDLKTLGARPDLRRRWSAIWRSAAVALPFAPWTRERLDSLLGPRTAPTYLLPCALMDAAMLPPIPSKAPVVRTAFHLASHARKNAVGLMRAVAIASRTIPDLQLEIFGGGDPNAFATLAKQAAAIDPDRIHLLGPRPNDEIKPLFNSAMCMALPSHRESFGMVFVEALMAGCPIVAPVGWAIDGYLPEDRIGRFVPSTDTSAIAEALVDMARNESVYKTGLAAIQTEGRLDCFLADSIGETYRNALDESQRARSH